MKKLILFVFVGLLHATLAHAVIPKAELTAARLVNQQWPLQYTLSLIIPKDHHAYLNKGDENIYLPIIIEGDTQLTAAGLQLEKFETPVGVYDAEVKAQVLRSQGDFTFWLKQTGTTPVAVKTVPLALRYQICNEITHVCFRPQSASFDIALPDPAVNSTTLQSSKPLAAAAESEGIMDKLLALFKNHQDDTLLLFGLMFLAGLFSVATPCVYPMLPITSMFVLNRAGGIVRKEQQHAFVYMLGMIVTYMLLGLIAGMTGGAFNAVMQSAWVNLGFAIFFAFFAISLLGYYEMGILQNEVHSLDQQSARVKGLTGTWLMGTVAGLVISPCVGPIVFALLLQIADNIAAKADAMALLHQNIGFWDKFKISAQGSVMMSGFGLGVSLPFFIVSVVKFKKLPKAGYWMNKIKYAFGLAILYFAYTYLQKGMGILGVDSTMTLTLSIALLVIWIAVVHFNVFSAVPADAMPNQKMYHFLGVITLIIGGWLMIASLGRLPIMQDAKANIQMNALKDCEASTDAKLTQEEAGIIWYRNFAAAQKVAQSTGKPMFIDFYASWCANCVAFKAETANNPELNKALREKAIAVKLVDQEPDFEAFRENPLHRQLKIGLPYFVILTPDGQIAWSGTDYQASQTMIAELNRLAG